MKIRPVEDLDLQDIAGIDEAISGSYRPETWEKRIMYYIRRDPEVSQVAEIDGKVVGFMLGEVRGGEFGLEEPTGWVEVLGVDPDCRGRSVGRRLAEEMWNRFRARGATTVRTLVDEEMPGIAKFFDALGFEPAPVTSLVLRLDEQPLDD
jgi:ribosomal protein S18 acetylase RimI-like enzyme